MPLPTKPKDPVFDMGRYLWLIYGPQKIGKTNILASWKDIIVLPTEPGTKGLKIFEIPINNWADFLKAVSDLEKEPGRFATVGIDTVSKLYDMALRYVCDRNGIPYPGESKSGKEDHGKSWYQVDAEFSGGIDRIVRSGRGIVFTCHAKTEEVRHRNGPSYHRIMPRLSGQATKHIQALVDIAIYVDYMRAGDRVVRAMLCQGDELVWAGARQVAGRFPYIMELKEGQGYEILKSGFEGRNPGLDPATLMPTKEGSQLVSGSINAARKGTTEGAGARIPPPQPVASGRVLPPTRKPQPR